MFTVKAYPDDLKLDECPADPMLSSCVEDADIKTAWDLWMADLKAMKETGTCADGTVEFDPALDGLQMPAECVLTDQVVTVKATAKDHCNTITHTCTFTVKAYPDDLKLSECPGDPDLGGCSTQDDIDVAWKAWILGLMDMKEEGTCSDGKVEFDPPLDNLLKPEPCKAIQVSVTAIAEDHCNKLTTTCTFSIGEYPNELYCEANLIGPIPECGDQTVQAEVTIRGGCEPYTIVWDGNPNMNTTIVDLPIGQEAENHIVEIYDVCGYTMCEVMVEPPACQTEGTVCTYTQGFYGNSGGMACDGEELHTTMETIENSILVDVHGDGDSLRIGWPGHTVTVYTGDAQCVIDRMPGGKDIGILPVGNTPICEYDLLTKQGRIDNKLLAQTLALGLNLGLGTPLGGVMLDQGYIVSAEPDGGCGSQDPLFQKCIYEEIDANFNGVLDLVDVLNPFWYTKIDQNVIDMIMAIGVPPSVDGLYELANQMLGNYYAPGVIGPYTESQMTAVAGAVDKINNVFDECRILVGYSPEKPVCDPSIPMPCYPGLPDPILEYEGSEPYVTAGGDNAIMYKLDVSNWNVYPQALFLQAPYLPPCGLNTNSSRTWVDIFDASNDQKLYGFCALNSPEGLNSIWFGLPELTEPPMEVYITIWDRYCDIVYTSEPVELLLKSVTVKGSEVSASFEEMELKVYPNPFSDKVTFEFVSAVDAYGILEIYNITGQRVARILDRQVLGGEMNRVEYEPATDATGVYLYKLDLDGRTQVGRITYRE
ncbi:T9SS C-terminal target domain-containing protein [Maribellus luteus]|uniref:T9SS C-terminal target domain-containing protein n=1 Tax=Maribellus luteus TaxID=2305463 RepID=A0A399T5B9_9BACT|nr:T9SS type A sorting domain-containing protein [Maribellus luteus]RIJ50105.1 T9SS C-terminal target domain-containing protein [Maribellus luteus]